MQVVIYSNGSQECERMSSLFRSLDTQVLEYRLDEDFDQDAFESEFGSHATYPQVSIGYNHVGDMKETLQLLQRQGII